MVVDAGGSQGSFFENGKFWSVTRLDGTYGGLKPLRVGVTRGTASLPCGPSIGSFVVGSAHTRYEYWSYFTRSLEKRIFPVTADTTYVCETPFASRSSVNQPASRPPLLGKYTRFARAGCASGNDAEELPKRR